MLKNIVIDRPLAFFDLETTGTDPNVDRIVEISIVKIMPDGRKEAYTSLVNPGMKIPESAHAVHGITDDQVSGLLGFKSLVNSIRQFLDGCDLCGFNIRGFDVKMLCAEFRRCGAEFPLSGRRVLDVLDIYRSRERRDLSAAVLFYTGKNHDGAHDAESDVLATIEVLDAQALKYNLPMNIGDLYEQERGEFLDIAGNFVKHEEDGSPVFAFGKHKGKKLREVERSYLSWMLNESFLDDAKAIIREALNPKVNNVQDKPVQASDSADELLL